MQSGIAEIAPDMFQSQWDVCDMSSIGADGVSQETTKGYYLSIMPILGVKLQK